MNQIYAGSEITLIAVAGKDETFGLPGVAQTARKSQPSVLSDYIRLVSTLGHPHHAIGSSIWSTRGWTYQKAVLSRRRLVFIDDQTYFECESMNCHESVDASLDSLHKQDRSSLYSFLRSGMFDGTSDDAAFRPFGSSRAKPKALNIDASEKNETEYHKNGDSLLLEFSTHVAKYTLRTFSFESDTLNAFSGIMQHLSKSQRLSQICGIPLVIEIASLPERNRSICKSLLWFHTEMHAQHSRKPRFPSWSWAGWNGAVDFWRTATYAFDRDFKEFRLHKRKLGGKLQDLVVNPSAYDGMWSNPDLLRIHDEIWSHSDLLQIQGLCIRPDMFKFAPIGMIKTKVSLNSRIIIDRDPTIWILSDMPKDE